MENYSYEILGYARAVFLTYFYASLEMVNLYVGPLINSSDSDSPSFSAAGNAGLPQDDEETLGTTHSNVDGAFTHPEVEIKAENDDKDSKKKQDIKDYVRN